MTSSRILCPSARCAPGSLLIGLVEVNGRISFASNPIEIDDEFVSSARQGRAPEERFRFASQCSPVCGNWQKARCAVADNISNLNVHGSNTPCAISDRCRWIKQIGPKACIACEYLVTDIDCSKG